METLVGEQGREILEQNLALGILRLVVVDFIHLEQGEIALAILGRTNLA